MFSSPAVCRTADAAGNHHKRALQDARRKKRERWKIPMTVVILISLESPVQVQDQDSQVEGQGQGEQENNLSCRVDLKVHCCAVWLPSTCRMAAPLFLLHLSMVVLSYRSFVIALPFDYL